MITLIKWLVLGIPYGILTLTCLLIELIEHIFDLSYDIAATISYKLGRMRDKLTAYINNKPKKKEKASAGAHASMADIQTAVPYTYGDCTITIPHASQFRYTKIGGLTFGSGVEDNSVQEEANQTQPKYEPKRNPWLEDCED
jgi:hypothetical protein